MPERSSTLGMAGTGLKGVAALVSGLLAVCAPRPALAGGVRRPRRPKAAAVSSEAPRRTSVRLGSQHTTLIAGASGWLEFDLRLKDDAHAPGSPLRWDRSGPPPVVWVSAPRESGIRFVDKAAPVRRGQQVMVKFAVPEQPDSQVLTTRVEYTIDPQTKAGEHEIWFDVSAPLVTAQGRRVQDMGVVTVSFSVDTPLATKLLMLGVIAAVIFLFIVEWVRVDVVAILMMVLLPELGLLDARYAFRGLSSNAGVAIIGVMIISYGLNRVGLVSQVVQPLLGFVGRSVTRLQVVFSSLIALISSVMQNTGAAVLFLPAIRLVASRDLKIPVARVLMPIGMAAILGGTMTMIGTSPLILLNDILPQGMRKFGLLELTPIGLALVVAGIVYLSTAGMRALATTCASRPGAEAGSAGEAKRARAADFYPGITGPYEIQTPDDYAPGDGPQDIRGIRKRFLVDIVATAAKGGVLNLAAAPETVIHGGLGLCAFGPEEAVRAFVREYGLVLREQPLLFKSSVFNPGVTGVVEVVVSPRSSLIGKTVSDIHFRRTFRANPLALHQDGQTYYHDLADKQLRSGDAVLVQGAWEQLHSLQDLHQNFIFVSSFHREFHRPEKLWQALACFAGALVLTMVSSIYFQSRPYNPIPLSLCLMAGAVAMVLTRVMTIGEAYRAVDWRTVFLLAGLIPLGMAVEQTGTAHWIARGIVAGLGDHLSPLVLLTVLAFMSCAFTMVISNVGACTLLVPLGISLANQIGVDPRAAVIVVGLGVSNSFILPTHQVNVLYMGPGEYRTRDYLTIGGGLSLVYIAILVAMTYAFYT